MSSICFKSSTNYLIIGGDWNADPVRKDGRTNLFKDFIDNENLYKLLELSIANVPLTYVRLGEPGCNPSYSTIDNFLISPNLTNTFVSY